MLCALPMICALRCPSGGLGASGMHGAPCVAPLPHPVCLAAAPHVRQHAPLCLPHASAAGLHPRLSNAAPPLWLQGRALFRFWWSWRCWCESSTGPPHWQAWASLWPSSRFPLWWVCSGVTNTLGFGCASGCCAGGRPAPGSQRGWRRRLGCACAAVCVMLPGSHLLCSCLLLRWGASWRRCGGISLASQTRE